MVVTSVIMVVTSVITSMRVRGTPRAPSAAKRVRAKRGAGPGPGLGDGRGLAEGGRGLLEGDDLVADAEVAVAQRLPR